MKLGLGLYRHALTRENFQFGRQAGATHMVAHLVDYFKGGARNPRDNQPTGSELWWGRAGDPTRLWTLQLCAWHSHKTRQGRHHANRQWSARLKGPVADTHDSRAEKAESAEKEMHDSTENIEEPKMWRNQKNRHLNCKMPGGVP
jgi:hypothetical protein